MLAQLNRFNNGNVFFVMMFHNVDIVPGCSPYAQNENDAKLFLRRLTQTLEFAQQHRAHFVLLSEIRDLFTGRHAKPANSSPAEIAAHV